MVYGQAPYIALAVQIYREDKTVSEHITLIQTDIPSRSKQGGPCWVAIGETYAATTPRTLDAEIGEILIVTAKVSLRRASGYTDVKTRNWTVRVTGNPDDTVDVALGSPQSVAAVITGVLAVED